MSKLMGKGRKMPFNENGEKEGNKRVDKIQTSVLPKRAKKLVLSEVKNILQNGNQNQMQQSTSKAMALGNLTRKKNLQKSPVQCDGDHVQQPQKIQSTDSAIQIASRINDQQESADLTDIDCFDIEGLCCPSNPTPCDLAIWSELHLSDERIIDEFMVPSPKPWPPNHFEFDEIHLSPIKDYGSMALQREEGSEQQVEMDISTDSLTDFFPHLSSNLLLEMAEKSEFEY